MEMELEAHDGNLERFEAEGATIPQNPDDKGYVEHDGAQLWYATYGVGTPVILLHGGLGHSGNWGYQVPCLIRGSYRVVLMDSRGHGRSTRDTRSFSYELMASDVLAVMDALDIEKASLVGWSDGACTALVLAATVPQRIASVFFFACNMDPSSVTQIEASPTLQRCFSRHAKDYAKLSRTPERFKNLVTDLTLMQRTQPNFSADDLAKISVPVIVVQGEHDEFIKREHAEYLVHCIPKATFLLLDGVSHFAPLQKPSQFCASILRFLAQVEPGIALHSISISEARTIRDRVLSAGGPASRSIYPNDDAPDTLHLGAFVNGRLAAVATICHEPMPGSSNSSAWRLRGMATLEEFRRLGLGKRLAASCIAHAAAHWGTLLWCSARVATITFYRGLGFQEQGRSFQLPEYSDEVYILMRRGLP